MAQELRLIPREANFFNPFTEEAKNLVSIFVEAGFSSLSYSAERILYKISIYTGFVWAGNVAKCMMNLMSLQYGTVKTNRPVQVHV